MDNELLQVIDRMCAEYVEDKLEHNWKWKLDRQANAAHKHIASMVEEAKNPPIKVSPEDRLRQFAFAGLTPGQANFNPFSLQQWQASLGPASYQQSPFGGIASLIGL